MYQKFRAPRQPESTLVAPAWGELIELAQADRPASLTTMNLAGLSGDTLAQQARESLLELAQGWTNAYAPLPEAESVLSRPIILSGHQPQLFHPGVWFKNFSLDQIAKSVDGIGIHLLIDSDLCREVAIRVPTGFAEKLHTVSVPFDKTRSTMPFEERSVADQDFFSSFANRIDEQTAELFAEMQLEKPMVKQLWPLVRAAVDRGRTLGEAISEGRHLLERNHGSQTLEVPFSQVCDTDPFRHFMLELLSRAEEFQTAYNGALKRYRVAHKLRNAAQPLPDLHSQAGWFETPFWVWSTDRPERRPLRCQRNGQQLRIADLEDATSANTVTIRWEATLDALEPTVAIEQLKELRTSGIKLRSRALATTLYCRHFLADLFLHGIGGAKYDQVTDDLSRQFFGIAPPVHATLTATLRLFSESVEQATSESLLDLKQQLRSLRYHPEGYLLDDKNLTESQRQAIADKQRWIQTQKSPENAHERHQAIEQANQLLYDSLESKRLQVLQQIEVMIDQLRQTPLLTSREQSFCLFSEQSFIPRLQALTVF